MQIDLKDVIVVGVSILGVIVAYAFGSRRDRRDTKNDDQKEATDMTKVSVKLDFIGGDVAEIKAGLKGLQAEGKETRERLIAVEQCSKQTQGMGERMAAVEASAKQAHKRLDEMGQYRAKPPDGGDQRARRADRWESD